MERKWRYIIYKCAFIFMMLSVFAAVDAHASAGVDRATVCVDSDYTNPRDYSAIRQHKMNGGANLIGTKVACVEERSKAFIIKSEMVDDIGRRSLGIKATRFALCNFDKIFRFGFGASADPFEVLHSETEGTSVLDWAIGEIRRRVNDKVDEIFTPGSDGLDEQCEEAYGFNIGPDGTTIKKEMQNAVDIGIRDAVSTRFCGNPNSTAMTLEQWSAYLDSNCGSQAGQAADLGAWLALQRQVRNAREGKFIPSREEIEAFSPKDNCPIVPPDNGRIFRSNSEASEQCSGYGRLTINGSVAFHCPSVKMPGPECGSYYAFMRAASENCSQYGTDHLPSGAARFYCPPKTASGPLGGTFFANIADATQNCTQFGRNKAPHGAVRFYCPPKVESYGDGGKLFALQADAWQACSQFGTSLNPDGSAQFYCPPKQEKAGAHGMWYASSTDASQACSRPGREESLFHSVHFYCPEPVQGIYRAKVSALGNCRNIGREPDRAGSERYYCRNR